MNKNKTYIDGYYDATKEMNNVVDKAFKRHKNDLLAVLNDIIEGMHHQYCKCHGLLTESQQQEELYCTEDWIEEEIIQSIIDLLPKGNFTVIIGGKK